MTNTPQAGVPGASGTTEPATMPESGMTTPSTGSNTTAGAPPSSRAGAPPSRTTTPSAPEPGLKDDAAALADEAAGAGRRVAETAKDESKAVASETGRQARRLADDVGQELRDQAAKQQTRVADRIRSVGDGFASMADHADEGMAADLVREAGRRADRVGQWLGQRDPSSLLREVKGYARRRPGVFLAIAVGAGVVVGRLTRALAAPPDEDGQASSGTAGAGGL